MARPSLRVFLILGIALTIFVSARGMTQVRASGATITLSASSGPPTTSVTVNGTGFGNSETVNIVFDATMAGMATSDNTGSFSTAILVPASALPGNHTLLATGQTSGLSASAPFLVRTDWSQYGFDPAHTHFNPYENVLNTSNVSGLVQKWGVNFASRVFVSSPTVANGIVYIASHKNNTSGASNELMYAFDASTGAIRWTFTAGDATQAAVDNGVVYFGSADGHLYARDAMTGAKVWTFTSANGIGNPPTIVNGVVYFAAGDVYALNATTGAVIWTFPNVSGGSPVAVANGMLYFGTVDAKLYALNASTGQMVWKHSFNACCIGDSPTVAGGMVYMAVDFLNKLFAFNASTGAVIWTVSFSFGATSPAVVNGVVYIGSTIYLYALNAATGKRLWRFATGGDISNPTVANGVVYLGSNDTGFYAVDATSGNQLFLIGTAGRIRDAPTVADGVVYVGTVYYAGHLHVYHLPGM